MLKRLTRQSAIVALVALIWAILPDYAHAQSDASEPAQQVLNLVNQARAEHGLPPLLASSLLMSAAQVHVDDMVNNQIYSHTGSDGSSVRARARRIGYASSNGVSENWVSATSPESAMAWWMNSYVHRGNILNGKWRELGVGVRRDPNNGRQIFVLVFGGGQDGVPLPEPSMPQPVTTAQYVTESVPPGGLTYTVQYGDTLSGIAARYGMSWQKLAGANGLGEHSILHIGQTIHLPGEGSGSNFLSGTGGATDVPGPDYMVQSGDTLISIALRYEITWEELAAVNGLREDAVLQIGQLLRIPGKPGGQHAASASQSPETLDKDTPDNGTLDNETVGVVAVAQSAVQTAQTAAAGVTLAEHVVAPGETVISIAQRHGIGWGELLRMNNLAEDTILQIGQVIRLPAR